MVRISPFFGAARRVYRGLSSLCSDKGKGAKYEIGNAAVVTGASLGIGFNSCLYLLDAGVMNVVMGDKDIKVGEKALSDLRRQYPRACLCFCKCDVTNPADVKNLFEQALELHGCIDILINNAGIFNEIEWDRMIDTNLKGVICSLQLGMNAMSRESGGKGGAIINVASILGLQPLAGAPVYTGTKHFIIGYTRSYGLPFHHKSSGVRVMAMCPGVTLTPLIATAKKDKGKMAEEANKELGSLPSQDVCFVGDGIIKILKQGESGSIWITEDEETYEVHIPDRKTLRV